MLQVTHSSGVAWRGVYVLRMYACKSPRLDRRQRGGVARKIPLDCVVDMQYVHTLEGLEVSRELIEAGVIGCRSATLDHTALRCTQYSSNNTAGSNPFNGPESTFPHMWPFFGIKVFRVKRYIK